MYIILTDTEFLQNHYHLQRYQWCQNCHHRVKISWVYNDIIPVISIIPHYMIGFDSCATSIIMFLFIIFAFLRNFQDVSNKLTTAAYSVIGACLGGKYVIVVWFLSVWYDFITHPKIRLIPKMNPFVDIPSLNVLTSFEMGDVIPSACVTCFHHSFWWIVMVSLIDIATSEVVDINFMRLYGPSSKGL